MFSLSPADSLRHASAISVLLAAFFVAICSVMAIHAQWIGETKTPRMFPDFADGVSVFSLFTTIPVFATAFGCHVNSKNAHNYYVKFYDYDDIETKIML